MLETLDGGDRVLVFSHDDPDGYGAAGILCRYLENKGVDYRVEFPHRFELTRSELEITSTDFGEVDLLVVADKGTFPDYDDLTTVIDPVVVIDHHPYDDSPNECLLYNPGEATCAGYQMHQLLSLVEDYSLDPFDDFLALLALRSDWIIQPLRGVIPDSVEPFYRKIKHRWPHLLEPIESRPTWMETNQRKKTLLINQISELYFALSGGAFQYFYNDRIPALSDRDQTRFGYDVLMESIEQGLEIGEIESLEEYISAIPESGNVQAVFDEYLRDWDTAIEHLKNTIRLKKIGPVDVYFYVGENAPLMPLVGSVQLGTLVEHSEQHRAMMIMVNCKPDSRQDVHVHCSFRSSGGGTHMGKLAGELASRVVDRYGDREKNSGGGHAPAAEMTIRSEGIEPLGPIRILMDILDEMSQYAEQAKHGTLSDQDREQAVNLGLSYLSEQ